MSTLQLKQLELQGFKTFASKTRFQFDDGITAIVGPNGSGKSNLADAVRWILGEQRTSMLRARKSDDLIFSGTEKRARMGMAQGFLTLDNSDGSLPIEFSEVVVGRRIYRNGESEYLLNGSRVRLRDVQELLGHASIGATTYTVIGQGLIDSALALRPAERRQLFEDAAGLGAYQGRRDDALRRLTQTEGHLTRVRDILAEIEPQMRRLKRQADRAEEYLSLKSALTGKLQHLYGYRWGQGRRALITAREQVTRHQEALQEAAALVAGVERQLNELRDRQHELRDHLATARQQRAALRQKVEGLRRDLAVAEERTRGYERQQQALQQENEALLAEVARLEGQITEGEQAGDTFQAQASEAAAKLHEQRTALAEAEAQREAIREGLREARRALGRLTAREGELTQQRAARGERQHTLQQEQESHQQALGLLREQQAHHERELDLLEEDLAAVRSQQATLVERQRDLQQARQRAADAVQAMQARQFEVERRLTALTTRRDLLARLRREGTGYEAGVRELLAARGDLDSEMTPVADLLRVPERFAPAVSAALGSQLQALALNDEGDAARAWIHGRQSGRVTLLPLPQLGRRDTPAIPSTAGVIGRASDMVQGDDDALLQHLLGGWLIVDGWPTVRSLAKSGTPWHLVTLDGQVRRRDGTIVAGRGEGTGDTLLAQSREWADLPSEIAAVEADLATASEALSSAIADQAGVAQALSALEGEVRDATEQHRQLQEQITREQREASKLQQEAHWRAGLLDNVTQERAALSDRATALQEELSVLADDHRRAEADVVTWEQKLEAAHPATLREAVERARTQVAILEEQFASWQRGQRALGEERSRLTERQAQKQAQVAALADEASTIEQRLATLVATLEEAQHTLGAAADQTRPLEQEQSNNEERLAALETQHLAVRKQRQHREDEAHTAELARQAAEERLNQLALQIESDLGPMEDEAEGEQAPTVEQVVAALPLVTALEEGTEEEVHRLRRRLGQLGAVNPDAPTDYVEVAERHRFLSEQSEDLTRAVRDLRKIVAELDRLMEQKFVETFEAIDTAFRHYFTKLFGGGQARLELTEPEDVTTSGIEIVARPPGKRAQSIALLSGGERALTAAALLFAILKISPTPFCVFDEVDAMLDEANIARFRDVLTELAHKTQFIVITHNRGTIEAARDIYGISQSVPGISDVISLQLHDAVHVAKQ